ncbi:MAG: glycosyltransferase involved in cell wall biosynthesis [Arenicella sp.]
MNVVSVIIPARGRVDLLRRAIASVDLQKIDFEVIVIDDGSEPPLSDLLPAEVQGRIRLLRNEKNKNAAYSRNRGVEAASCKVLAFLDSDDEWLPNHLALAFEGLDFSNSVIHVTALNPNLASGIVSDAYSYLFDKKGDFRTSGLVCGKKTFDLMGGFDEGLNKHQDWDFVLRASTFCQLRVGSIPTVRLDLTDKGRMSARPDLAASALFIEKHHGMMTNTQVATFFAGVIRSCVAARDQKQIEKCRQWCSRYISITDLDTVTKVLWKHPRIGSLLLHCREWFRKVSRALG